jgi:hypothetical protein
VVGRKTASHALFLNYFLDCLPAAVVRRSGERIAQLCAQTRLARSVDLASRTALNFEDIREQANAADPARKAELIDLFDLFVLEYEFRDVDADQSGGSSAALRRKP